MIRFHWRATFAVITCLMIDPRPQLFACALASSEVVHRA